MNERRLVSACQVMPNSDRNIGTAPTLAATRLRGRRSSGQAAHHPAGTKLPGCFLLARSCSPVRIH